MTSPSPTPGEPVAVDPPTRRPVVRRSMGTWRSLIISMALLVLMVAAWLALMPRTERVVQPAVDAVTTTRQVARDTRTPLRVAEPGTDWKATSVRVEEPTEGVTVLHAGYHRQPDSQEYVALSQTLTPTSIAGARRWLDQRYRVDGGTIDAAGLTWTLASQLNPARNVLIGPVAGNPVIVLVGMGSHEELAAFAGSLRPVGVGQLPVSSPGATALSTPASTPSSTPSSTPASRPASPGSVPSPAASAAR